MVLITVRLLNLLMFQKLILNESWQALQAFIQHMVDDSSQDTIENEEEDSFGHED